jgi:hypothetical protein
MFDQLISRLFKLIRGSQLADQVSYEIKEYGDLTDHSVVLILSHWNATDKGIERIVRQLPKNQHAIAVKMHEALSPDPKEVLAKHLQLRADLDSKLQKSKLRVDHIIAVSIGNIHAGYFADTYKVKQVDLITPGTSLADSLWTGLRTEDYKNAYIKLGYDRITLAQLWTDLSFDPYMQFTGGENCRIRMYDSKADKLIKFDLAESLYQALMAQQAEIERHTNKLWGHYLTLLWVWGSWKLLNNKTLQKLT